MGLALREEENRDERAIEFYNVLSNFLFTSSPIDCDSDNDAMDDGYEYYFMGLTNAVNGAGFSTNAVAVAASK